MYLMSKHALLELAQDVILLAVSLQYKVSTERDSLHPSIL